MSEVCLSTRISTESSPKNAGAMAKVILQCRTTSHPFNDREIPVNVPIKVGRAVAGCKPNIDNGYFNCKVLSRNHAVLFYENGKFYLQDTQSSNGTFVNNQKLPTQGPPSPAGMQGTLKGDQNEGRREVYSGDIVQFGVEVLEPAKKGQAPVAHGCIVASLRLFHADGTEQKASLKSAQNGTNADGTRNENGENQGPAGEVPRLSSQEIYELQAILQEAFHREHLLEAKLTSMNKIFSSLERKNMWNATFEEDFLLSKIQHLQGQLQSYEGRFPALSNLARTVETDNNLEPSSDEQLEATTIEVGKNDKRNTFLDKVRDGDVISDDYKIALIAEWKHMIEERTNFEMIAKEALQRALSEKLEATKTLSVTEERLFLAQTECDDLSSLCQNTQNDLLKLVEKFQRQSQMLEELTNTYQESEKAKLLCLESLNTEKIAVDKQLQALQAQNEEGTNMIEEIRAENERLHEKIGKLTGASTKTSYYVTANGVSSDSDENEDLGKERRKSFQNEYQENIFKGKNMSDLLRDMQDVDSEDEGMEYADNRLQRVVSAPEPSANGHAKSNLPDDTGLDVESPVDLNSSGSSRNLDDLNILIEGRDRLADLVTELQTQLEIEKEEVRFLKAQQLRSSMMEMEMPADPVDELLGPMRDLTMNDHAEIMKTSAVNFAPLGTWMSWADLDSVMAFVFLMIWIFCMAIFEWTT